MPCGLYADEARAQALDHRDELDSLGAATDRRRRRRGVVLAPRARAWSTASSCSATCSIPTASGAPDGHGVSGRRRAPS